MRHADGAAGLEVLQQPAPCLLPSHPHLNSISASSLLKKQLFKGKFIATTASQKVPEEKNSKKAFIPQFQVDDVFLLLLLKFSS